MNTNNKNFFDDLDRGWNDVIGNTYETHDDTFTLELKDTIPLYEYTIEDNEIKKTTKEINLFKNISFANINNEKEFTFRNYKTYIKPYGEDYYYINTKLRNIIINDTFFTDLIENYKDTFNHEALGDKMTELILITGESSFVYDPQAGKPKPYVKLYSELLRIDFEIKNDTNLDKLFKKLKYIDEIK